VSATPTDISLVAEPGSGRNESLPRNARFYFIAVAIMFNVARRVTGATQ